MTQVLKINQYQYNRELSSSFKFQTDSIKAAFEAYISEYGSIPDLCILASGLEECRDLIVEIDKLLKGDLDQVLKDCSANILVDSVRRNTVEKPMQFVYSRNIAPNNYYLLQSSDLSNLEDWDGVEPIVATKKVISMGGGVFDKKYEIPVNIVKDYKDYQKS